MTSTGDSEREPARPEGPIGWRRTLRGTGLLLGAQAGRLVLQMVQLFLIARILGPAGLASIAAVLALANILRPLSGLGYNVLVVEGVSRDPGAMSAFLGRAPWVYAAAGSVLGLAGSLFVFPFLELSLDLELAALLLLAELILGGLFAFLAGTWQAEERFAAQSVWLVSLPLVRVPILVAAALLGRLDLASFCWIDAGALLVVVATGLLLRRRRWGARFGAPREMLGQLRRGFHFAAGTTGLALLPEIDKILVPRLAGLTVAGQYAAGIRFVNFATLPLGSLLAVLLPRFFREGGRNAASALQIARQAWLLTIPYALLVMSIFWLLADLTLPLLGPEYARVPVILRWSVGLLLLQSLHLPAGNALTACGQARYRATVQVAAAGLIALVAIVAIPRWGWTGALAANYAGHAFLAAILLVRLVQLAARPGDKDASSRSATTGRTGPEPD